MEDEADPKRRAEKFAGRQARKRACREENADDRPNCRYGQPNRKSTDHPLSMQSDLPSTNVPERFAKREKEQQRKERGRCGLINATDCRNGETHH